MQQIIFDSSFLMAVVENPTTWFEDIVDAVGRFQPVLPDCVREELEKLSTGRGRKSRLAAVSLQLASTFREARCGSASVDDEIVSAALSIHAAVATADAALARSLRSSHVRVISLRSGRASLV